MTSGHACVPVDARETISEARLVPVASPWTRQILFFRTYVLKGPTDAKMRLLRETTSAFYKQLSAIQKTSVVRIYQCCQSFNKFFIARLSDWSDWSSCDCKSETESREKICTNAPYSLGKIQECMGDGKFYEERSCSDSCSRRKRSIPDFWSEWSECQCGIG